MPPRAEGDRPVNISTALSRAALSSPQVSKATRPSDKVPPRQNGNGSGRLANRVAGPSVTSASSDEVAACNAFSNCRGAPLTVRDRRRR